jgi:hypothetical protein
VSPLSAGNPPNRGTLYREAVAGDSASVMRALPEPVVKVRKQLGKVKRAVVARVGGEQPAGADKPKAPEPDGPPTLTVPPGIHVDSSLSGKLPVALVVLWQVPDERVTAIVDDVARLQLATSGFKPMFVTRSDDYAVFRRHGYLFEYLMPYDDWCKVRAPEEWRDYVEQRMTSIVETYRPSQVVTLAGDLEDPDDLFGCLLPLGVVGR